MASLGGIRHIGIGADFDGIEYTPEDIRGVQDIHLIFDELAKLNYKEEDISGIASGNFLRVFRQVLG
jgi:membrane dipeptidase